MYLWNNEMRTANITTMVTEKYHSRKCNNSKTDNKTMRKVRRFRIEIELMSDHDNTELIWHFPFLQLDSLVSFKIPVYETSKLLRKRGTAPISWNVRDM